VFTKLKHLTIRFNHYSQVSLPEFVKCLRVFYHRGLPVKIGSGCAIETVKWLDDMYHEVYRQEVAMGYAPDKMLGWLIQNNCKWHLLKLTDLPSKDMIHAMHDGIRHVKGSEHQLLRMEIDLNHGPLPDFLLTGNLEYLRLQVNAQNIDPRRIQQIVSANPKLRKLIVGQHVVHHGGSYDGNCTFNKVPLIPKQDVARHSGNRSTLPGFELKFLVTRDTDFPHKIGKLWRWYHARGRGRNRSARDLFDLNVFDIPASEWTEALLGRLQKWENEIKGWLDLCPKLESIVIVLNTDQNKFGRMETYWCTCNEKEYS
jgi:hypothetical protein